MKKWKKRVIWFLAAIVVLAVSVGVSLILLLQHSRDFRRDILARIEKSVEESTGARLAVGDFNVRLSGLTLDLYNVVVHGKEADQSRPLLQVDHVQVGLTIDSLLRRTWHVRNIAVDHPVVRMAVSKTGESNLPTPPAKKPGSSKTNVFDLAIRELKLDRGEIFYNDRKTPLDAQVRDLRLDARYDSALRKYTGSLGYNEAQIVYGRYRPVEHDLQAAFAVTPQAIALDKFELRTGKSRVILRATVNNYSAPRMEAEGSYEATLVGGDFRRILKDPSLPEGNIELAGKMTYQADPDRTLLETIALDGSVSSSGLAVSTPSLQTTIHEIYARYALSGGDAEIRDIHARILGGTLNGGLTVRDVVRKQEARLQLSMRGLSLDQMQKAMPGVSLKQAHLGGTINAGADARWTGTLNNLVARGDAAIQARLLNGRNVPVEAAIHAGYDAARKQLALARSYLRTPQTTLNLNGAVSQRSQLQVELQTQDLHELELIAAALGPAPAQQQEPLDLHGKASLTATVRGSLNAPQINGHLQGAGLRFKGRSARSLRAAFAANPSHASVSEGILEADPQGRIAFSGSAELKNWAYAPSSPLAINVSASQLSIADLQKLANQAYPVSGTLALNLSVHGTLNNPVGQGTVTVSDAKVSAEPLQSMTLKFQGNGAAVVANMLVRMPAGSATADLHYSLQDQEYQAQVQARNFRLEKLRTAQERNLRIAGGMNLNVSGRGTVKDPRLQATIEVPHLQVNKQQIEDTRFQATVQNQVAEVSLNSALTATVIKAHGTIGIAAPHNVDIQLDTGRIDLQPLAAIYAPAQAANLSGQTELHANVRGPLAAKNRLEAHVNVPTLALAYKQFQLSAAQPIRVDYRDGTVVLQPAAIRGTGTAINAQASVPLNSVKAASFLVQGTVDLHIAEILVPDLQSSGQIQFDLDSRRYGAGSNLNGQIKIVKANLHTADSPVGLDNLNGVFNVTQTRLEISSLQGQLGGGTIRATGAVAYRPAIEFQLGLAAQQVRVRYPEGVRALLASNLALTGNLQQSLLSGQVKIERVSFTPDFDLSTFAEQFSGETGDTGTPGSFTQGMKLNIAVQSTSQMNLVSSQISLRGDANLRVAGTAATPVILGRTNLTGGEIFLANNRYEVQQGTIDFLNPVHTEPVVNIQVRTTINEYHLTLGLRGPINRLETTYTSDPALPPVDIINLIARGKTVESAAANPNPPGLLGAQAALASTVSSQVSGKIAKLAGVSQLQIDPGLGTDTGQNPGARIAIQQRVTSNLLVTFASGVASAQRQAIQIEYKFNPRWSVSGTRNQNGGFGVDGKYRKDF